MEPITEEHIFIFEFPRKCNVFIVVHKCTGQSFNPI